MRAIAIAGVGVDRRWRIGSAERPIVANVGPQPAGDGLALRQNRHRSIIADALSIQHVAADQLDQRRQRRGRGADPVGERRDVEIDAFAGEALTLPVEREVSS